MTDPTGSVGKARGASSGADWLVLRWRVNARQDDIRAIIFDFRSLGLFYKENIAPYYFRCTIRIVHILKPQYIIQTPEDNMTTIRIINIVPAPVSTFDGRSCCCFIFESAIGDVGGNSKIKINEYM